MHKNSGWAHGTLLNTEITLNIYIRPGNANAIRPRM